MVWAAEDRAAARESNRRECAEQGVPEFITDPAVIERAVAIARPAVQKRVTNQEGVA